MALTVCEDCGHEVSSDAVACPSCGRPGSAHEAAQAQRQSEARRLWTIVFLVLLVAGVVLAACQTSRAEDCRQDANVASLLGSEKECSFPY